MEEKLISWLLGDLDEEEEMRLEDEYLCDEDKFRELKEIQNNLIDAYVSGKLPLNQHKRFEEQFLSSPWQRRRIVFAKALSEYTSSDRLEIPASNKIVETTPDPKQAQTKVKSWWHSILHYSSLLFHGSRYSFAALALLAVLGGTWLLLEVSRLRATISQLEARQSNPGLEQEVARERSRADQLARELQKERDERALLGRGSAEGQKEVKTPTILSFILSPGMVRGSNGMNRLVLLPGVSTVELKLEFSGGAEYESLRVQIRTAEGRDILSRDQLQSRASGSRRQVVLRLDSALLGDDDYAIKLSGLKADGEYEDISSYGFRVEKQ